MISFETYCSVMDFLFYPYMRIRNDLRRRKTRRRTEALTDRVIGHWLAICRYDNPYEVEATEARCRKWETVDAPKYYARLCAEYGVTE